MHKVTKYSLFSCLFSTSCDTWASPSSLLTALQPLLSHGGITTAISVLPRNTEGEKNQKAAKGQEQIFKNHIPLPSPTFLALYPIPFSLLSLSPEPSEHMQVLPPAELSCNGLRSWSLPWHFHTAAISRNKFLSLPCLSNPGSGEHCSPRCLSAQCRAAGIPALFPNCSIIRFHNAGILSIKVEGWAERSGSWQFVPSPCNPDLEHLAFIPMDNVKHNVETQIATHL